MHSIPAVTVSPNGRWLAGQSMDNKIVLYDLFNRVREKRKIFRGHFVIWFILISSFYFRLLVMLANLHSLLMVNMS